MRLHRFLIKFNLNDDIVEVHDLDVVNQIKNVFRLGVGDKIVLFDGDSNEATCEISHIDRKTIKAKVVERSVKNIESNNYGVLYCAVLKKENFEFVVQKSIECGIARIVPILTERTVKLNLNAERLAKIAREAAEQSGRADLPEISAPIKFSEALDQAGGVNLFFDQAGEPVDSILGRRSDSVSAWIGPEGGWTEAEIDAAKKKGFFIVSLGSRTLRGETAAIVAAYLISK